MKNLPVKPPLHVTEAGTTLVDSAGVKVLEMVISPALPIAQAMVTAATVATAYNHHHALASELRLAERIISAMFDAMTPEQNAVVAAQLERAGVSPNGTTPGHERRAVLAAVGA